MPVSGLQLRRCIVEPELGKITVRLAAHHMFQAGAEFRLMDDAGTTHETWQLATGAAGSDEHVLDIDVASLHRNVLTWEILVCAFTAQANHGVVEVQVLQQGIACALTKEARWALQSVPACETSQAIPIRASLEFIVP
jgi:hypothetical protein